MPLPSSSSPSSAPVDGDSAILSDRERRRRGGRPPVPVDTELCATVSGAVTLEERDCIRQKARATGLCMSAYLRSVALGHRVRALTIPPDFLRYFQMLAALSGDLRGLAGNVNQQSRLLNISALSGAGLDPASAAGAVALLMKLDDQLPEIRELVSHLRRTLVQE